MQSIAWLVPPDANMIRWMLRLVTTGLQGPEPLARRGAQRRAKFVYGGEITCAPGPHGGSPSAPIQRGVCILCLPGAQVFPAFAETTRRLQRWPAILAHDHCLRCTVGSLQSSQIEAACQFTQTPASWVVAAPLRRHPRAPGSLVGLTSARYRFLSSRLARRTGGLEELAGASAR
jgi:hypothetical protein